MMKAFFSTIAADGIEMVREQVEYRDLLVQLTVRDLRLRYKQAVMGFGWAVLMPLLNTVIFSVIFTRVAPIETPVAYPLFAYCGLLTWNLFASSLRFAVNSLTGNPSLVTKVYFPREILPFSSVIVCVVDFAVGSLLLVGMMAFYGVSPSIALAWVPAVLLVHVTLTAALALLLAAANLFYRDVKYVFEIAITLAMFGTSVLYPLHNMEGAVGALLRLNPMTPVIDGYRMALLYGERPVTAPFLWSAAASICLFACAWFVFHRAEFRFAESV